MSSQRASLSPHFGRSTLVLAGVALFHGAALWALQGALRQTEPQEIIIPAVLLSEFIAPPPPPPSPSPKPSPPVPPPPVRPAPPAPPPPTPPKPRVVRSAPKPVRAPIPEPVPVPDASPQAPAVSVPAPTPAPPAPPPVSSAPPSPLPVPAPPAPAPPRIELPSSNAAYLNNPSPAYPAISKRMGEQGKVVLRVLISVDGRPEQVEIKQSSGYDRLDRQAQDTVQRWRFSPGKRNGVAEAMWYLVPINFVLE